MKIRMAGIVFLAASCSWAQSALKYSEACSPEENIEIVAVGDVLLHAPLQVQATKNPERFVSLWSQMLPIFDRSDLVYANLEGPVAPGVLRSGQEVPDPGFVYDGRVYSSYPQFNYHPFLVEDLKRSGVDVVSTANNHALDRHSLGANRTIEQLEKNGLPFTGTQKMGESGKPWYAITEVKGRRIAWLACTFSTNGIPDRQNQVLPCYKDPKRLLGMVSQLARDPNIDAVIVTPHWGVEYQHKPHESQVWLGHQLIEAGATAVIGTHPHVVQPWEKYVAKDGREGFIIYSTGNFVSYQQEIAKRTSVLVQLNLVAPRGGGKMKIRGVQYLPLFMGHSRNSLEVTPILQFDSSVPSQALAIWKGFYNDNQRISSWNENTSEKICQASERP